MLSVDFHGSRSILAGIMAAALTMQANALTLYVAPDGNDDWSGTSAAHESGNDGPFATLERARDEIRQRRASATIDESITVSVAPGDYLLNAPLQLSEQDSGTADGPITYVAAETGSARLIGGKFVTNFERVTDTAVLDRLDPSARDAVYTADLKALGVTDFGEAKGGGLELFFNGKPMQIARWPNEGFVKIVDLKGGEPNEIHGNKGDRIGRFVYEGDRPSRWLDEKDAWLYGYWFWDWSASHEKIKSIEPDERIIEVEEPYHGYGYRIGQWYYALNLLSEIDAPGEWYLDRDAGRLYFWPPASIDGAETFVSVTQHAIQLNDTSHCTVQGFTIEGFRNTIVQISGGAHSRIAACTIRNAGNNAISITNGNDHTIFGCDLYDLAGGGISVNAGDRATLTPANHVVENNHLYDYARWYRMYNPGIDVRGVGNRLAHNLIHDAPHIGIMFGGNDHVFEYNEIHSVCYESNDAGAIYAGRDWTERGTVIRYNYLHHITGYEDRGCVGVYLDDMFCGTQLHGNLFYRVHWAAFIGGGRDNLFEKNLFVDCPKALHIDNRAQNWAAYVIPTTMTERLNAMPIQDAPWKDRFPQLLTILDDDPAAPKGNRITSNVFVGENWNDVYEEAAQYQTLENNLTEQDPQFATPEAFAEGSPKDATAFKLKTDSPAFDLGFEPLPLEKMGLYQSPDRASWPVQHAPRRSGN